MIIAVVIGVWIFLLLAGFSYYSYRIEQQQMVSILDDIIPPWKVLKQKRSKTVLLHQWFDDLAPIGKKVQLLSIPEELEDHLVKAGHPYGLTVNRLQGAKILGSIAGLILGFIYFVLGLPLAPIIFLLLVFGGYMIPILFIKQRAKSRQAEIRYELPDYLDMMSITLQAGMGLDEALSYYVETSDGPLAEEFARFLQEVKFGVQRETAYRSLMSRTTSSELEALIQSLIQAHNLGTAIAQTFAMQAEEMRRMRAEQAKEAAGKAAPKISIVSTLIIAPSIMILLISGIIYSFFVKNNMFGGF
ncbi:type II secretion system F family protein [Hazenella coriacea]|uniref:Tight adherence protein C n=1 Tax=Hazenella coriacea TaxID=1179467 RepID=A0A4R3L3I3_9BACL|nr:type II secretion system F family protein [Hazenella coriacea]TCS94261.1 tight adherence protein C [Hazenella coriacea]